MDVFKRETVVGCTVWDINAKCVHNKNKAKNYRRVVRSARRKNRENLKKMLDNLTEQSYNDYSK